MTPPARGRHRASVSSRSTERPQNPKAAKASAARRIPLSSQGGAVTERLPRRWRLVRLGIMLAVALLIAAIPLGAGVPTSRSDGVERSADVSRAAGSGAGSAEFGRVPAADDSRFQLAAETAALSPAPVAPSPLTPDPVAPGSGTPAPGIVPAGNAAPSEPFGALLATSSDRAFDAGNIISDAVFYDPTALTDQQISGFIEQQGAVCSGPACLKTVRVDTTDQPADRYCREFRGAAGDTAAAIIGKVSRACGVNPQVMLVTLQKESRLLDRTDPSSSTYDAAWGWHCPDTGPGGTAACDPAYAGLFAQAYGMAKQWARYRLDPDRYHYRAGQTADILYNVVESGCGSAPVTIANTATASLYNYTPYQPNAASLAAYPGVGDACSSYGNRNFFFLFARYFGGVGLQAVGTSAVTVAIPDNRYVDKAIAGRAITVPNAAVARGLRAGFAVLGMPYVWGGGGSGAGPDNGCHRGGGQYNSCGAEIGFDCSGLSAYVLGRAGVTIPGDSAAQRRAGTPIGWDQALPGDIVGFPGHVAVYLGTVGGERYILEASWVGYPVHIVRLSRGDADPKVHRYWSSAPGVGTAPIDTIFRFTPRAGYAAPPAVITPAVSASAPRTPAPSASTASKTAASKAAAPRTATPRTVAPAAGVSPTSAAVSVVPPTSTAPSRSSSAPSAPPSTSTGSATVTTSTIPPPTIPSSTGAPDEPPAPATPSSPATAGTGPTSSAVTATTAATTAMTTAATTTAAITTAAITTAAATTMSTGAPPTDSQGGCPPPPSEDTATGTAVPVAETPPTTPTMVPTAATTPVEMTAFEVAVRTLTSPTVDPAVGQSDCRATESGISDN